ncbi:VOC family protein [Aequorivita capsosiphonis]|uniref:VOC family protein n=1 Tax=Aequorivita capsosiphonis TaxID=487317 RepID=UPI0004179AAE|nr:VOC family protein [Aequorivita capsosiphonis]
MKTSNPVVWFEIYVNDLKRAKKFYETVLKLELSELPMPDTGEEMQMLFFPMEMNGDGAAGALVKMKDVNPGGNSTVVYFGSDDCSIEEKRIKDAGGKVIKPKQSIGEYGFMVLGSDTEGNMIGVHSES